MVPFPIRQSYSTLVTEANHCYQIEDFLHAAESHHIAYQAVSTCEQPQYPVWKEEVRACQVEGSQYTESQLGQDKTNEEHVQNVWMAQFVDGNFGGDENRLNGKLEQEKDGLEQSEHGGEIPQSFEMDEEAVGQIDSEKQRMAKNLEGTELQEGVAEHSCYP